MRTPRTDPPEPGRAASAAASDCLAIAPPWAERTAVKTTVRQDALHIIKLEAENFKRLRAVRIEPDQDGNLIQITGRNGQGKSSTLDAIMAALCGERAVPDKAVRKGHDKATITVTLGGNDETLIVTRKITKSGGGSLEIAAPDGSPIRSPQAVLDAMLGRLAFDPLAFARMEPRDQISAIKSIAGLNEEFAKLDAEAAGVQASLTTAKAEERRCAAVVTATQNVEGPDEEISMADLSDRLMHAQKQADTNRKAREWAETMRRSLAQNASEIESINAQIKQLQDRVAVLVDAGSQMQAQLDGNAAKIAAMVDPDIQAIQEQIRTVEETNAAARKRRAYREAKAAADAAAKKVVELGRRKEDIAASRDDLLAGVKFPVPGMSFAEKGITLNGFPFENASSAEQIRASFAIAMAQNPRLRIALVRQGSLLDEDGKLLLAQVAADHDAQVWVECVSNGEKVGIVIEDGAVLEGGAA